jgi:aryl-alcohol dehydrogenase-like predicted oxidoreductase
MEQRPFGVSELEVPALGVGTNQFGRISDQQTVLEIVNCAFEVGATLFDTAEGYGGGLSEEFLGAALRGRREDAIVVTKFTGGPPGQVGGGSRAAIAASLDGSLRRLRTDYIDIYLMHFPDPATPIELTLEALNDLVTEGKIRVIGCSNVTPEEVVEAHERWTALGLAPMLALETAYSLLERSHEPQWLALSAEYGLGILPYWPLARGLLTGKYSRGEPPAGDPRLRRDTNAAAAVLTATNLESVARLQTFAASKDWTLLELALGWLLSHPAVGSVIAGATSATQLRENASACTLRLTDAELAEVESLL